MGRLRWREVVLVLLLLMAAGLGGWRLWASGLAGEPVPRVLPASAAAGPPRSSEALAAPAAASAGPAAPADAPEAAPPAVVAAVATARAAVDVCGFGTVKRADLDLSEARTPPAWLQAIDSQREQGMAAIRQRLKAGTLRQQVAAALLDGDTQAAAQRAAGTADVLAYRMALLACRRDAAYRLAYDIERRRPRPPASAASGVQPPPLPPPGAQPEACAALNLERLELLAAGEAWPALLRLSDAQERRDEAAVGEALYRLAQGGRQVHGERMLTGVVAELVGPEPTPVEALALVDVVGQDATQSLDGAWWQVLQACRGAKLLDANRRQLCEQVAHSAADQALTAVDAFAMLRLREQLGLPPSPKALTREEINRGLLAMGDKGALLMTEPTCANVSATGRWVVELARQGELASIRAHLKASAASAPR